MEHNYPLQNNSNNAHVIDSDNLQSANVMQFSSNDFYNNTNSSGTHTDSTSNSIIPTSTVSNEQWSYYPYESQYIGHNINEQNQNLLQNPPPSLLNYPQTNETFTFEIPGFKIIVVPTTSPIANYNMQNQIQQDLNYSNNATDISHTQLHQQNQNSLGLNDNFNDFRGNFNKFRG